MLKTQQKSRTISILKHTSFSLLCLRSVTSTLKRIEKAKHDQKKKRLPQYRTVWECERSLLAACRSHGQTQEWGIFIWSRRAETAIEIPQWVLSPYLRAFKLISWECAVAAAARDTSPETPSRIQIRPITGELYRALPFVSFHTPAAAVYPYKLPPPRLHTSTDEYIYTGLPTKSYSILWGNLIDDLAICYLIRTTSINTSQSETRDTRLLLILKNLVNSDLMVL